MYFEFSLRCLACVPLHLTIMNLLDLSCSTHGVTALRHVIILYIMFWKTTVSLTHNTLVSPHTWNSHYYCLTFSCLRSLSQRQTRDLHEPWLHNTSSICSPRTQDNNVCHCDPLLQHWIAYTVFLQVRGSTTGASSLELLQGPRRRAGLRLERFQSRLCLAWVCWLLVRSPLP